MKRKRAARKHAEIPYVCSICLKQVRGNGGRSSHRRAHVRKWIADGRPRAGFFLDHVELLMRWEERYS